MIDERKLIEVIKNVQDHMREANANPVPVDAREIFTLFIEMVEKQPKVDECEIDCKNCWKLELLKPRWIPCSDRLPNTNGVYNITRKISDGEYKFYISDSAYFDGQDTWHADNRVNHDREYLQDVVAWKSLNEPYKEENNDDIE